MSAQIIPMPGASLPGDVFAPDRSRPSARVIPFPRPSIQERIDDLQGKLCLYHAARKVKETDNLTGH
jgi:hypothetical protein